MCWENPVMCSPNTTVCSLVLDETNMSDSVYFERYAEAEYTLSGIHAVANYEWRSTYSSCSLATACSWVSHKRVTEHMMRSAKNEASALSYLRQRKAVHEVFDVGFFWKDHPYLAASPDSITLLFNIDFYVDCAWVITWKLMWGNGMRWMLSK